MTKPRILFINPLPPPVHGSAMVSQYIKDSRLIQDIFDADFVNLSTSRSMDEIGKQNVKKIFRFVGAYLAVLFKLLFHRYDLCYLAITCHGNGFLKDAPFVLLCKLFRCKVVIHQHNKGMSEDVVRWPYRWLLPLVYRDTKVILLSWFLYEDIERVVKREQVIICPNGIPEIKDLIRDGKRNNEIPRLLFLSNLIESKGVYVLLDACRILKERGCQFICDFVGGETKEIDRFTFENETHQRGIETMVVYHGSKYGIEKNCYWNQTDIFVFPTFYSNECLPLVLLEAMQWRLPIVTTDEGGIPDVVKDGVNGLICKRKDAMSLAVALERLITEPHLRVQMGETGYLRYKKLFTLERFEQRLCDILNDIVLNIDLMVNGDGGNIKI